MKIVTTGIRLDENFGLPTVLHGTEEVLRELYGEEFDMINYTLDPYRETCAKDYKCTIKYAPPAPKKLLLAAVLNKFGIRSKEKEIQGVIDDIKTCDIVTNLFAIFYCDKFGVVKYSYLRMLKQVIGDSLFLFIGKMYGKKTVKSTSSFGPMDSKMNSKCARYAIKHLWDVVVAREVKSKEQIDKHVRCKKQIYVAPDMANYMKYSPDSRVTKCIGISVSHQIIKQWKSSDDYLNCIAVLCDYIVENTEYNVILIPNEFQDGVYNDIDVANEIYELLKNKVNVSILDVKKMLNSEIKNVISSCDVIVSSRYHSCVAALSSGVPTLVLGWHYKYDELLALYGQRKYILSSENCTVSILLEKFKELFEKRMDEKNVIIERGKEVRKEVLEMATVMYGKAR